MGIGIPPTTSSRSADKKKTHALSELLFIRTHEGMHEITNSITVEERSYYFERLAEALVGLRALGMLETTWSDPALLFQRREAYGLTTLACTVALGTDI